MPIESRRVRALRAIFVMLAIGIVLFVAGAMPWFRTANAAPKEAEAAADPVVPTDDLQRSLRLDDYTIVADSGARAGMTSKITARMFAIASVAVHEERIRKCGGREPSSWRGAVGSDAGRCSGPGLPCAADRGWKT